MSFKRIVSQERVIKLLKGTINKGRIPGAFIFSGDPLIGKTTTAIEYAKALNCQLLEDNDSCDSCPSCKKIDRGIHPDFKIIKAEKDTITVENIRELEEFVSLSPLEGKYKVVIVKNAEKLNQYAANAMLKTLEEPPPSTLIILTCENVDILPEALVSRAFKVHFTPLSREAVEKLIESSIDNRAEKNQIIKFSMGRPGFFLSMDILKRLELFKDTLWLKRQRKSPWKDNEEIRLWLDFLFIFLRDMICFKILYEKTNLYFEIKDAGGKISLEQLFTYYDKLQNIRKNIDLNLNKSILWNYCDKILRRLLDE